MNQSLKIYRHLRLSGTFSFRTAAPTPFSSHKSSKHFSISSQPDVTRRQFSSSISSVPPIATKRRKMVRSRAKDIPIQDLSLSFLSFQQLVAYTTDLPPNRLILAEVKTYSGSLVLIRLPICFILDSLDRRGTHSSVAAPVLRRLEDGRWRTRRHLQGVSIPGL